MSASPFAGFGRPLRVLRRNPLLRGLAEAEHGALTYFLPALAAGIWCALARWSGAAFITPLGALLLLLCAGLGGMALLRGKGWGLDGAQAVGFAAMLLLAAQAQALQLALRPTAEGSQAAFTALLWVPQLYGALWYRLSTASSRARWDWGWSWPEPCCLRRTWARHTPACGRARCSSLPRPACRARRRCRRRCSLRAFGG